MQQILFCNRNGYGRQGVAGVSHQDWTLEGRKGFLRSVFVPDVELVRPRGHVSNRDAAAFVRDAEVIGVHGQYHRGHLRMNVAKHIGSAGTIEHDGLVRARLVEPEIESLAAVKRKYAVKPWIEIRK